jgi:hypothetical protein
MYRYNRNLTTVLCLMSSSYVLCLMSYVLCLMPYVLLYMHNRCGRIQPEHEGQAEGEPPPELQQGHPPSQVTQGQDTGYRE